MQFLSKLKIMSARFIVKVTVSKIVIDAFQQL